MSDDFPKNDNLQAEGLTIGVVSARFNYRLVQELRDRVTGILEEAGAIVVSREVPGSLELPFAAAKLAGQDPMDAVIVLGVVIAGDTQHHEHIAAATSYGIQKVSLEKEIPVINGILVTESREQAESRTIGTIDKGAHFAQAAVEMAAFHRNS